MGIAILNASDKEFTQRNFKRIFPESRDFNVRNFEYPEKPDAAVITGSSNGVYENKAWIEKLLQKIEEYASRNIPMLGVCFGHQAIAESLGGKVENLGKHEIGYRKVEHDHPELFKGLKYRLEPFVSHEDHVASLPEELEKIAETERHVYGIKHREKPVFGVQFHPEYDTETAKKVIKSKNFDRKREKELISQVTKNRHRKALESKLVIRNFHRLANQHQTTG